MTVILGIETSCDETAAAVVMDGAAIRSNVIASQVDLHARYGGVFPEIASRAHIENIYPVVDEALSEANVSPTNLDAIESDTTEDFPFTFHFHALEKEMATHSSVLAWRIPGTGEPSGLPSLGLHSRTRLTRLSSSSSIY